MREQGVATEALVLRRFDFGESSQTARLFTRDLGRIGVLARGIKRPGPDLRGPMDLFACADVQIHLRRKSDLHLMQKYRVRTGFPGLRQHGERIHAAFYLTEILREGTRDMDSDPVLYHLAQITLLALEVAEPRCVQSIVPWFELRFLERIGFRPELARCVRCAGEAPPGRPVRLAPYRGGILCRSCADGGSTFLLTFPPRVRQALTALGRAASPEESQGIVWEGGDHALVREAFSRIFEGIFERELKSAPFLR